MVIKVVFEILYVDQRERTGTQPTMDEGGNERSEAIG